VALECGCQAIAEQLGCSATEARTRYTAAVETFNIDDLFDSVE
jgi:hypothetical protein